MRWIPESGPAPWCATVYDSITGIDHSYGPFPSREVAQAAIDNMKEHDELAPWAIVVLNELVPCRDSDANPD